MEKKLILLFSHQLSEKQKEDADKSFGINTFVNLPENLQKLWSDIPPTEPDIVKHLSKVKQWLVDNSTSGDYVLIQGDFGATYYFVRVALNNNLIPVYSTTQRVHEETIAPNGDIVAKKVFSHIMYRDYANVE